MRQHYKCEHWAPCRNHTPSWYDWKIVESDVKPEFTHTHTHINICWVPRKMFEHSACGLVFKVFKQLPQVPANVNAMKQTCVNPIVNKTTLQMITDDFAVFYPFQQYISHIRMLGGLQWRCLFSKILLLISQRGSVNQSSCPLIITIECLMLQVEQNILNFANVNYQIHHSIWHIWWCRTSDSFKNIPALPKLLSHESSWGLETR